MNNDFPYRLIYDEGRFKVFKFDRFRQSFSDREGAQSYIQSDKMADIAADNDEWVASAKYHF